MAERTDDQGTPSSGSPGRHASPTAIDPVCGMEVTSEESVDERHYAGHAFYFCSTACVQWFDADPERYKDGPPPGEFEQHYGLTE